MQEALLHYIWKNSYFNTNEYIADTGEKIIIVDTGIHNTDSGPDFTNARIKINRTLWVGNVEIHKKNSEWEQHSHHRNTAYDNVILHVSLRNDRACFNSRGRRIPSIILSYDPGIETRYDRLLTTDTMIPCYESLPLPDASRIYLWLGSLTIERLSARTASLLKLLSRTKNGWEETYYISLARSFGLKINTLPFEMLAQATPLKVVTKHSHDVFALEALFFGQAGFLIDPEGDEYYKSLRQEYRYLQNKYQLKGIEPQLWKFLRLRPANFPTVRIAQFCSLMNNSSRLFSITMESDTIEELLETYSCSVSDYWKNHYKFGKKAEIKNKPMGTGKRMSLIINTIVPFMFIYGQHKNRPDLKEKAIRMLEMMPAEVNRITKKWEGYRIHSRHAGDSQALYQLATAYCSHRQCLTCRIGNLVLRNG